MERDSTLVFPAGHPAFAGHFPGSPIVPGVLLLDAAMHALETETGRPVVGIAAAKFLHPVAPGELLEVSLTRAGATSVRFEIASDSQRVATGQLLLQPQQTDPGTDPTSDPTT